MMNVNTWGPVYSEVDYEHKGPPVQAIQKHTGYSGHQHALPNKRGRNHYRFLEAPLQKQQLHKLHEGRLLDSSVDYHGDLISHEDEEGLRKTKAEEYVKHSIAEQLYEQTSRQLGGSLDLPTHPAVQPALPVEDPALRSNVDLDSGAIAERLSRENFQKLKEEKGRSVSGLAVILIAILGVTVLGGLTYYAVRD